MGNICFDCTNSEDKKGGFESYESNIKVPMSSYKLETDKLSSQQKFSKVLSFKNFKGFKKVENIMERYKIGKILGEGSFG
jgi:hypothetical protein